MSKYNLPSYSISESLLDWMLANTSGNLLQLGSGAADQFLSAHYHQVLSIEHDSKYVGQSTTKCIHARIYKGWYSVDCIKEGVAQYSYSTLLIDGPNGYIGRSKFLDHLDLFNLNATLIVDDTHRAEEHKIFQVLSGLFPQRQVVHISGSGKKASILI